MKEVMKTNIYDVDDTIIIVGSCLKDVQPKGFKKLEKISKNIYDLLLKSFRLVRNAKDNLKDYSSIQIAKTLQIYRRLGQMLFKSYSPRKYLVKKEKAEETV